MRHGTGETYQFGEHDECIRMIILVVVVVVVVGGRCTMIEHSRQSVEQVSDRQ